MKERPWWFISCNQNCLINWIFEIWELCCKKLQRVMGELYNALTVALAIDYLTIRYQESVNLNRDYGIWFPNLSTVINNLIYYIFEIWELNCLKLQRFVNSIMLWRLYSLCHCYFYDQNTLGWPQDFSEWVFHFDKEFGAECAW